MGRPRNHNSLLTELELQIMGVVWDRTPDSSVEEIRSALEADGRPLALPSVRTMLGILQEKGYLSRRPEGKRFRYKAEISRPVAQQSLVRDVVDRAFDGSALDLVAALIDTRAVSEQELQEVKKLIANHEGRIRDGDACRRKP
ncbi:MAG: BlaI family penicillinase repressor [Verrucomicrobiales bacterium]|jgi:BlaI family penicillinase repressor